MKTALSVVRARCNYSQAMLAEAIGVSRQMVCAWENGSKKLPEARAAELAALFGVPSEILKEEDLPAVERWCDRPLFSAEKQGRQVFSFEPPGRELSVFLSQPGSPMPAERSRELAARRSAALQRLTDLSGVRAEQQAKDLSAAELCVQVLECAASLLDCAAQAGDQARARIVRFVLEQLRLLEQVFADGQPERDGQSDWQKQQLRLLRTHWAQMNRSDRARAERVPERLPDDGDSGERKRLPDRLNELYHRAMAQGVSRWDLQLYFERILMEEYDDERQS